MMLYRCLKIILIDFYYILCMQYMYIEKVGNRQEYVLGHQDQLDYLQALKQQTIHIIQHIPAQCHTFQQFLSHHQLTIQNNDSKRDPNQLQFPNKNISKTFSISECTLTQIYKQYMHIMEQLKKISLSQFKAVQIAGEALREIKDNYDMLNAYKQAVMKLQAEKQEIMGQKIAMAKSKEELKDYSQILEMQIFQKNQQSIIQEPKTNQQLETLNYLQQIKSLKQTLSNFQSQSSQKLTKLSQQLQQQRLQNIWIHKQFCHQEETIKKLQQSNNKLQSQNQQLLNDVQKYREQIDKINGELYLQHIKSASTNNQGEGQDLVYDEAEKQKQEVRRVMAMGRSEITGNRNQEFKQEDEKTGQLYRVRSLESINSSASSLMNPQEQGDKDSCFNHREDKQYMFFDIPEIREKVSIGVLTDLCELSHTQTYPLTHSHDNLEQKSFDIDIPMLNFSTIEPKQEKQLIFQQKFLSASTYTYRQPSQSQSPMLPSRKNLKTARMHLQTQPNQQPQTSRSFIQSIVHKKVCKPKLNQSIADINNSKKNKQSYLSKLNNNSFTDRIVRKRIKGRQEPNFAKKSNKVYQVESVFGSFKKLLVDSRIKK